MIKSTSVQVQAGHYTGDKPLTKLMLTKYLTVCDMTRPQWVNSSHHFCAVISESNHGNCPNFGWYLSIIFQCIRSYNHLIDFPEHFVMYSLLATTISANDSGISSRMIHIVPSKALYVELIHNQFDDVLISMQFALLIHGLSSIL